MEWSTTFLVFFRTSDLGACQTPPDTNFNSFCTRTHGCLNSGLDCTAIISTAFKLLGDLVTHNGSVQFRLTDFKDIDLDIFTGEHFKLIFDHIHLSSTLTDNNTGTASMNGNSHPFHGTFNNHAAYAILNRLVTIARIIIGCFRLTNPQIGANLFIFYYLECVIFICEPVRIPAADNS